MPEDSDNPDTRLRGSPSAGRNTAPIVKVLQEHLPSAGRALEIASGSGQHASAFARAFPGILWFPSDPDERARDSIAARAETSALDNLMPPLNIDVASPGWQGSVEGPFDAMLAINLVHIAPWSAAEGLFRGAGALLAPGGLLYLYGPYRRRGAHTADSNIEFDAWLKERNDEWGVRDMGDLERQAKPCGLHLDEAIEMPANNFSLMFRRE